MGGNKVSEETRRTLVEMFLPELHQSRWAEALAKMRDEQRAASSPEAVEAIEARIREHYKHQHDVEQTRREVLGDAPAQKTNG